MKLQTILTTMVTAVTLTAFAATTMPVSAASDTQTQISSNQSATDKLVAQLAAANTEVINLQNQINDKNTAIKDAQTKITDTEAKIKELAGEVTKTEAELSARKDVLKKQLISLQKQTGDSVTGNVYVDFALNSKDLSDLISRASTVNKLNQANKDALAAVNDAKAKLTDLQNEQVAKKQDLVDTKASLESDKASLVNLKSAADTKSDALNKKIAANKDVLVALQDKAAKEDAAAKASLAKLSAAATTATTTKSTTKAATKSTTSTSSSVATKTPAASTGSTSNSGSSINVSGGTQTSSDSAGNAYAYGQCTWYVKSVAPWAGNHWGNGGQWGASAAAEGFTVNNTPSVGSIVVVAGGQNFGGWTAAAGYGHVAYVVGVSGNSITVQQGGMGFSNPGGPNTQTVSGASSFTYIHR
ncbi:CHAP domain-containing protein [Lacticaseibacillus manihotivorans]|jgi:peptidoglycan hydrolase CwlO-like protein|nr:CHAP domain-containing protein [Lacticaseibacillus manihotivorans]QFQ92310.1 CHAP domain-containing protein [Lacticaseibacillus manihotivorans]